MTAACAALGYLGLAALGAAGLLVLRALVRRPHDGGRAPHGGPDSRQPAGAPQAWRGPGWGVSASMAPHPEGARIMPREPDVDPALIRALARAAKRRR